LSASEPVDPDDVESPDSAPEPVSALAAPAPTSNAAETPAVTIPAPTHADNCSMQTPDVIVDYLER
jgi:hypothetical protein